MGDLGRADEGFGSQDGMIGELLASGIEDFADKFFDYICDSDQLVAIDKFTKILQDAGLGEDDPRLKETFKAFEDFEIKQRQDELMSRGLLDKEMFNSCISDNMVLIAKALRSEFVIPGWKTFTDHIDTLYEEARENEKGQPATYIPQLARVNPEYWGVSVCSVDGQRHSLGDTNIPFSLQSVVKPLDYALVLNDLTPEVVHKYVGREPSGKSFNELTLDIHNKPHNPMINAGAIVVSSLFKNHLNIADRFDCIMAELKRLAGGGHISFNNSVYLSERATADRNFALGYYMRENKCFPEGVDLHEVLEFYFQLCSIQVTCESGAVIAATLANGGICPTTGERVLDPTAVRNTLSLMHSCGMYDYSGQFAFKVGLPAKSGVSGGILLVVPNVMGIFMWAPPLDNWGNSYKGVQFCEGLVAKFNFHNYDNLKHTSKKYDPRVKCTQTKAQDVVNLLFSAYNGDITAMRRFALLGMDMSLADYDGRTALHLAAVEDHAPVVIFLLDKCHVTPFCRDRWDFTPYEDAKKFKHHKVAEILRHSMSEHPERFYNDVPESLDAISDSQGSIEHGSTVIFK